MRCYDCGARMFRTGMHQYGGYIYRFFHCRRCGLHDVRIG